MKGIFELRVGQSQMPALYKRVPGLSFSCFFKEQLYSSASSDPGEKLQEAPQVGSLPPMLKTALNLE